jgi:hypothetical protein
VSLAVFALVLGAPQARATNYNVTDSTSFATAVASAQRHHHHPE